MNNDTENWKLNNSYWPLPKNQSDSVIDTIIKD